MSEVKATLNTCECGSPLWASNTGPRCMPCEVKAKQTGSDQTTPTPTMAFSDLLCMDAIRRENHCERAICAYEADCACWQEFAAYQANAAVEKGEPK